LRTNAYKTNIMAPLSIIDSFGNMYCINNIIYVISILVYDRHTWIFLIAFPVNFMIIFMALCFFFALIANYIRNKSVDSDLL